MCDACSSTATAPTDRTLQAEALLGCSCTCAGPAGPDYCDLHSPRMLLDLLARQRCDQDERDEEVRKEGGDEAAEEWREKAKELHDSVNRALAAFKEALPAKPAKKALDAALVALEADLKTAFEVFAED